MIYLFSVAEIGRHFLLVLSFYDLIALKTWSVPSQLCDFFFFVSKTWSVHVILSCFSNLVQIILSVWLSTVAWLTPHVVHSGCVLYI